MIRLSSDRGETMAEYSLIFALVVITIIVTTAAVGTGVLQLWSSFADAWPA